MDVKATFYIKTWFQNSLMSIATGLIVGYFSSVVIVVGIPPVNALIGAVICFIVYQYVSFNLFFGGRRGEFEFKYKNDLSEKYIKKLVLKRLGIFSFVRYFQDQFNAIRPTQKDICKKLLKIDEIKRDCECLYYIYYKLGRLEFLENNFKQEKTMLQTALSKMPSDMLANYRLAISCEMDGFIDDAMKYYKIASEDPKLISKEVRQYIIANIERIKLVGPKNRPPTTGAKYQSY